MMGRRGVGMCHFWSGVLEISLMSSSSVVMARAFTCEITTAHLYCIIALLPMHACVISNEINRLFSTQLDNHVMCVIV